MNFLRSTALLVALVFQAAAGNAADDKPFFSALKTAKPAWLFGSTACPADVLPKVHVEWAFREDWCSADLDRCLEACRQGGANECLASARLAQAIELRSVSDVLFLRACSLGSVSGCTNRAASMLLYENDTACSGRTFELTCSHDNAWGCTMFGRLLSGGLGLGPDLKRARGFLEKACTLVDENHEACIYAGEMLKLNGEPK